MSETFGVRSQNNLGKSAASRTRIKTNIRVLNFTETVLNVTFNRNFIGN